MNLYGYAAGDPINNSDPFGLCSQEKWWTCKILSFTGGLRLGLGANGSAFGNRVAMSTPSLGLSATVSMGTDGVSLVPEATVSAGTLDIKLGPIKWGEHASCSTATGCAGGFSGSASADGASVSDKGDVSFGATVGVVKVGAKVHVGNTATALIGMAKWLFRQASDAVHVGKDPEDP